MVRSVSKSILNLRYESALDMLDSLTLDFSDDCDRLYGIVVPFSLDSKMLIGNAVSSDFLGGKSFCEYRCWWFM